MFDHCIFSSRKMGTRKGCEGIRKNQKVSGRGRQRERERESETNRECVRERNQVDEMV